MSHNVTEVITICTLIYARVNRKFEIRGCNLDTHALEATYQLPPLDTGLPYLRFSIWKLCCVFTVVEGLTVMPQLQCHVQSTLKKQRSPYPLLFVFRTCLQALEEIPYHLV